MSTNTENKMKGLQSQSEQLERTWDVLLNEEVIGLVHGQTRERAEDIVRVFRNPAITIREHLS